MVEIFRPSEFVSRTKLSICQQIEGPTKGFLSIFRLEKVSVPICRVSWVKSRVSWVKSWVKSWVIKCAKNAFFHENIIFIFFFRTFSFFELHKAGKFNATNLQ